MERRDDKEESGKLGVKRELWGTKTNAGKSDPKEAPSQDH